MAGDENLSPYRSGPKLVSLFNEFGRNDVYGQGFPSMWKYAADCIRYLKKTDSNALCGLIEYVFDPREFLDTDNDVNQAIEVWVISTMLVTK